ncbi:MAG: transcription-repair coupling factor [Anaerovoracaceae bacterium]|jgi:transcription-repair coupling factor (superfamily II helicase)
MNEWGQEGRFRAVRNAAKSVDRVINITGISESRASSIAAIIAEERGGQLLIITPNYLRAKRLAEDLYFFSDKKVFLIPEEDRSFLRYDAKSHHDLEDRMAAMTALAQGRECIVVTPVSGAIKKISPLMVFKDQHINLVLGEEVKREELIKKLNHMGYDRVDSVEAKGQYCIRGGIVDIFPTHEDFPCRIELFDMEIDSIRTFDVANQRSIANVVEVEIWPATHMVETEGLFERAGVKIRDRYDYHIEKNAGEKRENLIEQKEIVIEWINNGINRQYMENFIHYFYDENTYLWDYLLPQGGIIIDDPERAFDYLQVREKEQIDDFQLLLDKGKMIGDDYYSFSGTEDFKQIYDRNNIFVFTSFSKKIKGVPIPDRSISVLAGHPATCGGRMDFFASELRRYQKAGFEIRIVCSTEERASNIKGFLEVEKLEGLIVQIGQLSLGVEFPHEKIVIFSEGDIFPLAKHSHRASGRRKGGTIKAFTDISKGDYVVHENHGIGKFLGVEQLEIQGIKNDYLKIKYAGEDFLYIPIGQMDLVQKYVGGEGVTPKINKLSGGEWKKTKLKAKAAIKDMAKDFLALSAARQLEKGHAFGEDTLWQGEFEDLFPYEETGDQLRCVAEIKGDMEKPVPMDRLLCGDVGYGKTEVAARAIFKCAAEGKQAAILVPTTILANQHYYNFKERFDKFPFTVDMLSRFRSEKQQETTIQKLKKGTVDIVVGTHRMLSKDVSFADLGLLVIDEEQRFGVQHKDAIKRLRRNVDILTLSATPIPRTLHMSLMGIRDISVIEEPPGERYPIQTYVMEQDFSLIRDGVEREINRGGQVYIVFNRVKGINKVASQIKELLPQVSIATAHGQMNEGQLENIMMDFVDGRYQVLVATTIIESGIDIPNVNTIIILDADHFGLSQLYQLRGRVGRSDKMSYAYLMYQKDKILSEAAEKRLRAIKEFTEFGSGFRIAMRDLEIRGAGNLLGTEQHGHMLMIGYELYCKLMEDAVRELGGDKGEGQAKEEALIELPVEAYIPETYISDELTKLHIYKQIAAINNNDHKEEIIDELLDRFGEIPMEALNLIEIGLIKSMAEKARVSRIHLEQKKIVFTLSSQNSIKPQKFAKLSEVYGMNLLIHGGVQPMMKLMVKGENLMKETLGLLTRIVE